MFSAVVVMTTQIVPYRFGSGFTLHAKIKLSAPPVQDSITQSRRFSFRRQSSKQQVSPPTSPPATSPEEGIASGMSLGGGGTFNPYDTTSLHIFIKEAFPGAILLEEHQVCNCIT